MEPQPKILTALRNQPTNTSFPKYRTKKLGPSISRHKPFGHRSSSEPPFESGHLRNYLGAIRALQYAAPTWTEICVDVAAGCEYKYAALEPVVISAPCRRPTTTTRSRRTSTIRAEWTSASSRSETSSGTCSEEVVPAAPPPTRPDDHHCTLLCAQPKQLTIRRALGARTHANAVRACPCTRLPARPPAQGFEPAAGTSAVEGTAAAVGRRQRQWRQQQRRRQQQQQQQQQRRRQAAAPATAACSNQRQTAQIYRHRI